MAVHGLFVRPPLGSGAVRASRLRVRIFPLASKRLTLGWSESVLTKNQELRTENQVPVRQLSKWANFRAVALDYWEKVWLNTHFPSRGLENGDS